MSELEQQDKGLWQRIMQNVRYCISDVWEDTRSLWSVRTVKIVNLSVQSFLDRDLQMRACALTYNTVLAIVPALAMLFAIGRGFGFQNLLQSELFRYFPAQQQALETAFTYVDNYLAQASQGAFIGIGLVVLLWTLVSLMGNVEDTFNHVWGVTTKRSLQRKFTDYTALFLLLPVLMVCSAGISIFMSDAVQEVFTGELLSPLMHHLLAFMPTVIAWIIFTAAFYLVPNTKVKFTGALVAGILSGTLFQCVQWLFVTGQMYVSKYNAIYGSFAFLPLLLVWLQLSWLITLAGVVLTYAWQNFENYAHREKAKDASTTYSSHLAIAILSVAANRFKQHEPALTRTELLRDYELPSTLVDTLIDRLSRAGLLNAIAPREKDGQPAYQPAFDPDEMTVNEALNRLGDVGNAAFIPKADSRFAALVERLSSLHDQQQSVADVPLIELADDKKDKKRDGKGTDISKK